MFRGLSRWWTEKRLHMKWAVSGRVKKPEIYIYIYRSISTIYANILNLRGQKHAELSVCSYNVNKRVFKNSTFLKR